MLPMLRGMDAPAHLHKTI